MYTPGNRQDSLDKARDAFREKNTARGLGLTFNEGESVSMWIDGKETEQCKVTIHRIDDEQVRVNFQAPDSWKIYRDKLLKT